MTTDQIRAEVNRAQKEEFIALLRSTERDGIENLINYLENKSDFFEAPAASKFHNNFEGGLCEHSLNVYKNFKNLIEMKQIELDEESIVITSLLHDLCKCNYYIKEERNRKVDGVWETYLQWTTNKSPALPLPHASRSIKMIKSYIPLKFTEELIIFYHMGPFGGEDYEYRNMMQLAFEKYPATLLFYLADTMSSYIDEKTLED
ncbi:MAG: HD domain-containing protein [Clostridia bacterium]|nr:HD domain-containing protein [Clostridia bacterium]